VLKVLLFLILINHSCSSRREVNRFCGEANLTKWAVAGESIGGPVVGGVVRQKGEIISSIGG
jgi:hypothetical protein